MPNTRTYVAIVERIPGREFHAQFPDFPGVRVSDATIEDVRSRSSQVLCSQIDQLLQANEEWPRPISVDEVKEDGRYCRGFLIQIDVEAPE